MKLVTGSEARAVDERARTFFGLTDYALVEAAAASCALALRSAFSGLYDFGRVVILAGKGNNAADTLALARRLVIDKRLDIRATTILLKDPPPTVPVNQPMKPFDSNLHALQVMGAVIRTWNVKDDTLQLLLTQTDFIFDGLAGTGLEGELRGSAREIAEAVNKARESPGAPVVVAVDLPSGLGDFWLPGMCLLGADVTLAVEPRKACLYLPSARLRCGRILACEGVFPPELDLPKKAPVLTDFRQAAAFIPPVRADAYKQSRGVVEIRSGSVGTSGAAKLAAKGACAAGAGLVKLRVDKELWPVLAISEYGAIVRIDDGSLGTEKGTDVCLAGPGWGRDSARMRILESLIAEETRGLLLVLDADALHMIDGRVFSGNTILTPHPLEFSDLSGIPKETLLQNPDPHLLQTAKEKNAVIILKGHVSRIAAPDGRLCYIDGLCPVLATGGTGDVLAGLIAGLVARAKKTAECNGETGKAVFDPFPATVAATALIVEAGKAAQAEAGFCDAAEFARMAGKIAGAAWLAKEQD